MSVTHSVDGNGVSKRRIRLVPRLLGIPVVIIVQAVDHRIEGRINAPAVQNIFCFRVILVADAVAIRSGGCDQEVQRLRSCIAGALRKNIHKASIRLGMKLIKHQTGNIQTVFCTDLR